MKRHIREGIFSGRTRPGEIVRVPLRVRTVQVRPYDLLDGSRGDVIVDLRHDVHGLFEGDGDALVMVSVYR